MSLGKITVSVERPRLVALPVSVGSAGSDAWCWGPTGESLHSIKAKESADGLEGRLRSNPGASTFGSLVAQNQLDDLTSASGSKEP